MGVSLKELGSEAGEWERGGPQSLAPLGRTGNSSASAGLSASRGNLLIQVRYHSDFQTRLWGKRLLNEFNSQ